MKVSVSIPESDVASRRLCPVPWHCVRSAALQRAIRLLQANELSPHYAAAFAEWALDGEDSAWDAAVADGLGRD